MKNSKPLLEISLSLIIGTGLISFSLIQSPAIAKPQNGNSKKITEDGKKIFQKNCATCHGAKGAGDGPASSSLNPKPRDFIQGKFKYGSSDSQLFQTISKGVSGSAMPPWKGTLSDEQIHNVSVYVKSLKK